MPRPSLRRGTITHRRRTNLIGKIHCSRRIFFNVLLSRRPNESATKAPPRTEEATDKATNGTSDREQSAADSPNFLFVQILHYQSSVIAVEFSRHSFGTHRLLVMRAG